MAFFQKITLIIFGLFVLASCKNEGSLGSSNKVFTLLSPDHTHIDFNNEVKETAAINYYKYVYLYNGGGVGLADINQDGQDDVYLCSTMGKDKLYINKGNLEFEDISAIAGIDKFAGCKTGVNFVDINQDGKLDIYVCRAGWSANDNDRRNLLFLNKGNNQFIEVAKQYGLDDPGYSIQSVFLDYDKDGDLDMYLGNHPKQFNQPIQEMIKNIKSPNTRDSDKFYRNNGNGTFTEIGKSVGIFNYTYSLGLATGDLNNDGWTDIYVTSDFQPRDHYYVNNGDGTFTESLKEYFPHCSYFAMGVDLVDINNDQNLDVFVGEMLSEDNVRQKTNMAPMDMQRFSDMVNNGMHYQYMRNSFNINMGNGHFSDIAHIAGIDKSDWSWSALFGDYDLDGDDDLLIVNGWLKDTQDKDFSKKTNELAKKNSNRLTFDQAYGLLESTPLENYAFSNEGNYTFEKNSKEWGFDLEGHSQGMASSDLDRDGDLDIVLNNMNGVASVYRNNTNSNNFVALEIQGIKQNPNGLNARLTLETDNGSYFKEHRIIRGFQSTSTAMVHFGLKENEEPIRLHIAWANGTEQIVPVSSHGYHKIKQNGLRDDLITHDFSDPIFIEENSTKLSFKHEDKYFNDYDIQVLLPHQLSQLGPALAVTDINGDGLDDFFIGGAKSQEGAIYTQNKNSGFSKSLQPSLKLDHRYEDVEATFLDIDSDGDQDLYVGSGSYENTDDSSLLQDRLYINDGKGNFSKDSSLPKFEVCTGSVSAGDYDSDGDLDLFIGGRLIPGAYPTSPKSYILQNNKGVFTDVSEAVLGEHVNCGMINMSCWTDFNADGKPDLIAGGEWTDILFFQNNGSSLELVSDKLKGGKEVGWWNNIIAKDLDGDGDLDYIVGNLGKNYKYTASDSEPFEMYNADFDNNGKLDIVLAYHQNEKVYPVRGFQCSSEQIPELKEKIASYKDFGMSSVEEVYGSEIKDALHFEVNNFESIILWNEENQFVAQALPTEAQFFPIQGIIAEDFDQDGDADILCAGNWFVAEVETPRADSGTGLYLENKGDKVFEPWSVTSSGFFANKDVRDIKLVKGMNQNFVLVANNNDELQIFKKIR